MDALAIDITASRRECKEDYWRLRDFEYAQPLYDLAFVLELDAISRGERKPKYRTFALWKAALHLDGYGSNVDRWLDGTIADEDLDQVPSSRIRTYLQNIRDSGTIDELEGFLEDDRYRRCLRLRRLRGLGPAQIAQTLSPEFDLQNWIESSARRCKISDGEVRDCFNGDAFGTWQTQHLIPPLLRVLHAIEVKLEFVRWELPNIQNPFDVVDSECRVNHDESDLTRTRRVCRRVIDREKMFSLERGTRGFLRIVHSMGWSARLDPVQGSKHLSTSSELANFLDPLTSKRTDELKADLHLHTSWSDGAASIATMANAAAQNGLEYLAVTDHSRSCKLQGGLTPVEWLRQSNSIAKSGTTIPLLHGIEVDILPDGHLDLPASLLSYADFVVGSVHSNWTDDAHTNTHRIISAIESGCIDVIGHPTSAVTGKPGVPDYVRSPAELDWERVFQHCAKWQVALEFNCFPSRFDLPLPMLRKALDTGCWLTLGSDAHARSHLSHIKFGQRAVQNLDTNKVLNFLSISEIREWLRNARTNRIKLGRTSFGKPRQPLLFEEEKAYRNPLIAKLNPPLELPSGSPVVGIDLTGSDKPSGVALLVGNHVETCSLVSNEQLIQFIREKRPAIVSIDSPLGLPGGGTEIDPNAGIVRVAEHDLSSIGISAYPALIDSMKELTLRGIKLRKIIETMDGAPKVIESYPGAAQDILCLPRKQRSLRLLREGLEDIGLTGPGLQSTSHDEIDAITSAVVGRFYESGNYEAMGIPSEAQLIVPTHQLLGFENPPVICLSGKTGSGKSIVARYLAVYYGFHWCRTRDLVRELLLEDASATPDRKMFHRSETSGDITEKDLQDFGAVILRKYAQVPLQKKLLESLERTHGPVVVDSIRDIADIRDASQLGRPIYKWFVDSSETAVKGRLRERAFSNPSKNEGASPVDETASLLRAEADVAIRNSATLEELRWKVDDELLSSVELSKRRHPIA